MRNALLKTHLTPMLAKADATPCVAVALGATGTWDICPIMPSIGIVQTQDKVT
jgi:hypothetical protein